MGQHLIFAVPDSVVEPTVAPPAHPSEVSDESCTLQRLTSDPDIYIVPLDGCGVNKHVRHTPFACTSGTVVLDKMQTDVMMLLRVIQF